MIVGDLLVPWRPGEGALFTLEHFEGARRSLAADGVFCQWLPLYQLSEAELQIVFRTFLTVFPRAQVWRGDFSADEPALALVASATPMPLDPAVVAAAVRSSAVDDANPHIADPAGVWMYFAGVLEPADLPAGDDRLKREDRPWLELIGPWTGGPRRGITGRRLQAWLGDLRARDAGRLAALGPSERAAMEAGDWLFELCSRSPSTATSARGRRARLRLLLPPRTYAALFPALDPER